MEAQETKQSLGFRRKRSKIRRSRNKKKSIDIFYNNINGFKSKMTSLESIVQSTKPHIIALCETKLSKNSNGIIEEVFNKKEYKSFPRFTKVGKEGLLIAVKHNTFKSVLEVTQSQLNTIISVRLSSGCSNIRLILGYAPQETEDETVQQQFFDELELEVTILVIRYFSLVILMLKSRTQHLLISTVHLSHLMANFYTISLQNKICT